MEKKDKIKCKLSKTLVEWFIPKKNINKVLLGEKYDGLLFKKYESAGKIEFSDFQCKLSSSSKEKVCDKTMISDLKFKNGNADSVLTPLAVINYHIHPLTCYIDAETIWGWPSGEDLRQCISFARDGNVSHIIFAIEGTYIIDVNKNILQYIDENIEKCIELLFQLTHNYRVYNENTDSFFQNFCKPINIKDNNIVMCWIKIVNLLTMNIIVKLCKTVLNKNISDKFKNVPSNIMDTKIYNIQFVKNGTIQWNPKLSNSEIYKHLKSRTVNIKLPENIKYKAPFISEECKL